MDCGASLFRHALHELSEDLEWRSPAQCFSGPVAHQIGYRVGRLLVMHRQIGALGKELAQQSVGVGLVATACGGHRNKHECSWRARFLGDDPFLCLGRTSASGESACLSRAAWQRRRLMSSAVERLVLQVSKAILDLITVSSASIDAARAASNFLK